MSDNRTTELREKLTKRGVEYDESTQGNTTFFRFDYCDSCGDYMHTIAITGACISAYSDYLTPEQAIAATLGSDEPPYDELLRCLENDWNISASWDGLRKFWCIELTEEGVRLRDEWNARAERTCRIVEYDEAPYPVCSECGAVQPDDYTVYFCWNCGAKVRNA